jgi:hypothetical protein
MGQWGDLAPAIEVNGITGPSVGVRVVGGPFGFRPAGYSHPPLLYFRTRRLRPTHFFNPLLPDFLSLQD